MLSLMTLNTAETDRLLLLFLMMVSGKMVLREIREFVLTNFV